MDGQITGALYLLLVAGAIAVIVAWVLLPFAMFGIKPLLRELLAETRYIRQLLDRHAPHK